MSKALSNFSGMTEESSQTSEIQGQIFHGHVTRDGVGGADKLRRRGLFRLQSPPKPTSGGGLAFTYFESITQKVQIIRKRGFDCKKVIQLENFHTYIFCNFQYYTLFVIIIFTIFLGQCLGQQLAVSQHRPPISVFCTFYCT